ncbi:MAG: hypothetical protein M3478_05585 [Planctomycetota bacterium]|nr:hypothetical protein [Planctomycetota bacterium]
MDHVLQGIVDPLIRAGVVAAVERTLRPAMARPAYPGHFTVTVDGRQFGSDTTWPGLDSWEMAGAYLLLGYRDVVRDYFAFVKGSQRKADGNIPFAIFPGDRRPEAMETYLRGMQYPDHVYDHEGRKWIGLFEHWQTRANPLSVLAPICYVLTASEFAEGETSDGWLRDNVTSVKAAAEYVLSRRGESGLIAGAGFYIECPPRDQWDGMTQCYAVAAFRLLAGMFVRVGDVRATEDWTREADALAQTFRDTFWLGDHFAEYVHPTRGVVDLHGFSDVDFASIALNVATDEQAAILWPRLTRDGAFWHGGMPTQLVSEPFAYQDWEKPEDLPFVHPGGGFYDVAAMGRVWHLDALACARMGDRDRLRASARLVCEMGQRHGWQWHERYHAQRDGTVQPAGPAGYCEYPAVLVRVTLGNVGSFAALP